MGTAARDAEPPHVELLAITKRFGPTTALDGVTLALVRGEVLGLLGENGAGKSTLMNVLYGLLPPDGGELRVGGRAVRIASPREARALGIGMVHQHFTLAPGLTVAENFALDEGGASLLWFDRRSATRRVTALAETLGFRIDPGRRVGELSVGDQQRAEILKALKGDARILVLDEPTATLTPGETDELFVTLRRLRDAGRTVVLITHKLREVLAIADRVAVLRRGRLVAVRVAAGTSAAELGALMVEGAIAPTARAAVTADRAPIPPRVEVAGLVVGRAGGGEPAVRGVDLELTAGRIVAVAGVDGNGQTELAEALAGIRRPRAGRFRMDGQPLARLDPRRAAALGIAYVPADRRRVGLVAPLSVEENLVLKHRRRRAFGRGPLLDRRALRRFAKERIASFGIRPEAPEAPASRLSGGNQQRVVLARELAFEPRLVLLENPTRGLDLAATAFVHERIREAAGGGAAVLVVTTDLDEALLLADELHVMYEGRLTRAVSREPEALGALFGGARS